MTLKKPLEESDRLANKQITYSAGELLGADALSAVSYSRIKTKLDSKYIALRRIPGG
eukprot:CAMPEP_0174737184 /NCGR_PEP_ID=MMETSP1094-20130205/67932_1 /TAXON_ID=156173 /ORGANISM="Chrysochromulina brevifilum, Strain UTEX LB 985" /LENGTH=56 /DNA_ID=CAMNT_0015940371 /DNA_START=18 /DNA_END=184 /DNA_ORIENTATION=+